MQKEALLETLERRKQERRSGGFEETTEVKFKDIGDKLVGVFERRQNVKTKFGPKVVFEIRGDDEVLYSIWAPSGLVTEMEKEQIQNGQQVAIEFVEEIDVDKGNPFKRFVVVGGDFVDVPPPTQTTQEEEIPF